MSFCQLCGFLFVHMHPTIAQYPLHFICGWLKHTFHSACFVSVTCYSYANDEAVPCNTQAWHYLVVYMYFFIVFVYLSFQLNDSMLFFFINTTSLWILAYLYVDKSRCHTPYNRCTKYDIHMFCVQSQESATFTRGVTHLFCWSTWCTLAKLPVMKNAWLFRDMEHCFLGNQIHSYAQLFAIISYLLLSSHILFTCHEWS
jgi:hypothetical protein